MLFKFNFKTTRAFWSGTSQNVNLVANDDLLLMFLTFKLNTCFSDSFTLETKSQSIDYLRVSGSEDIY